MILFVFGFFNFKKWGSECVYVYIYIYHMKGLIHELGYALFLSFFFFFFVASQNGETGKSIVSEELAFGGGFYWDYGVDYRVTTQSHIASNLIQSHFFRCSSVVRQDLIFSSHSVSASPRPFNKSTNFLTLLKHHIEPVVG